MCAQCAETERRDLRSSKIYSEYSVDISLKTLEGKSYFNSPCLSLSSIFLFQKIFRSTVKFERTKSRISHFYYTFLATFIFQQWHLRDWNRRVQPSRFVLSKFYYVDIWLSLNFFQFPRLNANIERIELRNTSEIITCNFLNFILQNLDTNCNTLQNHAIKWSDVNVWIGRNLALYHCPSDF